MHASDGWISSQAMFISQRCAPSCRFVIFQRSRRCRRLPPVHRLPPWGDLWREQTSRLELRSSTPSTGKTCVWPPAILLQTRFSTMLFHTATRNCLIYLYLSDYIRRLLWSIFTKMVTLSPNVQTDFHHHHHHLRLISSCQNATCTI